MPPRRRKRVKEGGASAADLLDTEADENSDQVEQEEEEDNVVNNVDPDPENEQAAKRAKTSSQAVAPTNATTMTATCPHCQCSLSLSLTLTAQPVLSTVPPAPAASAAIVPESNLHHLNMRTTPPTSTPHATATTNTAAFMPAMMMQQMQMMAAAAAAAAASAAAQQGQNNYPFTATPTQSSRTLTMAKQQEESNHVPLSLDDLHDHDFVLFASGLRGASASHETLQRHAARMDDFFTATLSEYRRKTRDKGAFWDRLVANTQANGGRFLLVQKKSTDSTMTTDAKLYVAQELPLEKARRKIIQKFDTLLREILTDD